MKNANNKCIARICRDNKPAPLVVDYHIRVCNASVKIRQVYVGGSKMLADHRPQMDSPRPAHVCRQQFIMSVARWQPHMKWRL